MKRGVKLQLPVVSGYANCIGSLRCIDAGTSSFGGVMVFICKLFNNKVYEKSLRPWDNSTVNSFPHIPGWTYQDLATFGFFLQKFFGNKENV